MVQIEILTNGYNSRNIHQPQSCATNLKIFLKLGFIGFLGLPDCRRASSQGYLEQRWRRKSLSIILMVFLPLILGSTDEQDIGRGMVVKKEKQNVYQIRRQQFRQCRRSSCQTCWKGCSSLSALWWLEKTDLLTRRATKGPTSWMVPARIPPKTLTTIRIPPKKSPIRIAPRNS